MRWSLTTGDTAWTTDLVVSDLSSIATHGEVIQVPTVDGIRRLSVLDGSEVDGSRFWWCRSGDDFVELNTWWWEDQDRFPYRSYTYPSLCDEYQQPVSLATVWEADPDAVRVVLQEAGNGWAIGVGSDGVLHGFLIGEA